VYTKRKAYRTILSYSAEFGYKNIVSSILEREDVDVNSKDQSGRTPLWWAAQNGNEAVVKVLLIQYSRSPPLAERMADPLLP
jgi:ankyrin repeat protein